MPGFAFYFSVVAIDFIEVSLVDNGRFGFAWDAVTRKLLNGNTFAALYLRELDPDGPPRDLASMRKQAREHFIYALEIATDSPARLRRVEVHLPPMAVWIFLVGRIIYRYCQSNQDGTGEPELQRWIEGRDGGN